jgi:2-succinyl-5-enolpyruvyl-6-hydroxy-3-cyclohexene-1-carboxylate synthase
MRRDDDQGLINYQWAYTLIDALAAAGVRYVFAAPGSRSTPLVLAAARHPAVSLRVHYDERGTAYMALGAARGTGIPAAWITTSGTAVANGMPAVVEASVDAVPMILLTADRPPELRHTGANQTIDQVQIFGHQVRWFFDLPAPDASVSPEFLRRIAQQATRTSLGSNPGPVHLNCMFREPLAPTDAAALAATEAECKAEARPLRRLEPAMRAEDVDLLREHLGSARGGIVVAGRLSHPDEGRAVAEIADRLGFPLLADIASGLRTGAAGANRIAYYDSILATGHGPGGAPDLVLHFGERSVSKSLGTYLKSAGTVLAVRPTQRPLHLAANEWMLDATPEAVLSVLESIRENRPSDSLEAWKRADEAAGRELETSLQGDELSEPAIARAVFGQLEELGPIVLGSSMPVRDADKFASPSSHSARVFVNRGASGIDGTIATAIGVAETLRRSVTILLGDLALLHDLNSLGALTQTKAPIRVIVVNNDGGGIFSMLPIRALDTQFEFLFGTPHGLGFEGAASMFGMNYLNPTSMSRFVDTLKETRTAEGHTLIELRTDRDHNALFHRSIIQNLGAILNDER